MDKAMSAALMADFTEEQIGHKPATWCKACAAAVKNKTGKSCTEHRVAKCPKCKTSVTTAHTCLDFVGHADVRARLCAADPEWTWAPFDFPGTGSIILSDGQPVGLWITLTVGGVPKPGYGSVDKGKPEAMKELIGDALRNAGLSFGIAWKLWAKGERGGDGEGGQSGPTGDAWDGNGAAAPAGQVSRPAQGQAPRPVGDADEAAQEYANQADKASTLAGLEDIQRKAREARKIGAVIRSPSTGNPGKLALYIDWKRRQIIDTDAALTALTEAGNAAGLSVGDLDAHVSRVTGAGIESATIGQLREATAALAGKAAA